MPERCHSKRRAFFTSIEKSQLGVRTTAFGWMAADVRMPHNSTISDFCRRSSFHGAMCCNVTWLWSYDRHPYDVMLPGLWCAYHCPGPFCDGLDLYSCGCCLIFNRSAHEIVPLAPKGEVNAFNRCDQYVSLPGFDLLQGAQMKVAEFSQALLGHALACTHASH